jgi:hypothetical protein
MTLIVAVDSKGGLLFCGRRQSQDRLLRERILEKTAGGRLLVSPYTAKQFSNPAPLTVAVDPLKEGKEGDFVFLENTPLSYSGVKRVLVYRWGRHYPADLFLSPTPEEMGMRLVETRDLSGFSHHVITEEIWENLL